MSIVTVLRSTENPHLVDDLRQNHPHVQWVDVPMPFLPGRGESSEERATLLRTLQQLTAVEPGSDAIYYARAYGAFSHEGRAAIQNIFSVPVVSAPGAILAYIKKNQWHSPFVFTPYGEERHQYEVEWLKQQGLNVPASACLGYDDGHDINRLSEKDIIPGIQTGMRSPADGVYLACTITRVLTMSAAIHPQGKTMISATEAMLWQLFNVLS
ncbi:MAG: hypothetical protein OWS74_03330 [Firmicutes bacterium]|nr:hypothetical protein [Bacillota bacterium]